MQIYGDESCVQSNEGDFMVIGALSCDKQTAKEVRQEITILNTRKHKSSEWHFTHLGNKPQQTRDYQEFCDIFVKFYQQKRSYKTGINKKQCYRRLCFDALVIEHSKIDHAIFSNGDAQIGFFRFYYNLLAKTLEKYYSPDEDTIITLDKITLKKPELRTNLQERLNSIVTIKSLNLQDSKAELLLQLADVLTGAISFRWNRTDSLASSKRRQAKEAVVKHLEDKLNMSLRETTYAYRSLNIWKLEI